MPARIRCRTHAALWIACVTGRLVAASVGLGDDASQRQFETRTLEIVWSLGTRGQSAVVAVAGMLDARFQSALPASPAAESRSLIPVPPHVLSHGLRRARARAWFSVLALRLAVLACVLPACLPLLAAGLADGLALRRARRREDASASRTNVAAAHALVFLAFLPVAWAVSALGALPMALPAWTGVTAMVLAQKRWPMDIWTELRSRWLL
jgi:hypothetical protein